MHLNRVEMMAISDYVVRARAKKMADANVIGIDDALISQLVERFYIAIRDDDVLGPIFAAHIIDWPPHLARMKNFWASVTLESGRFRGNPMLKHIAIGGLQQMHFDRWLALWRDAVSQVVPHKPAASIFLSAADRIAQSLLTGIEIQRAGLDAVTHRKEQR